MLRISSICHYIEVERLDICYCEQFCLGFLADARRIHKEALSNAISLVEVFGNRGTDSRNLINADFKLVWLQIIVQRLEEQAETQTFQDVQVGKLRIVEA